jgi:hypothetical protein
MLKAVAAANELIKCEVTQALADGHSTHFMRDGRIIERTRDGDFELTQVGDELLRSRKVETDQALPSPLMRLTAVDQVAQRRAPTLACCL